MEGKQLELPEVFYDPHISASTIATSRRFSLCLLANTEYPFFDLQILVSLFNEYFPAHPKMKKLSFAFNSYSIYWFILKWILYWLMTVSFNCHLHPVNRHWNLGLLFVFPFFLITFFRIDFRFPKDRSYVFVYLDAFNALPVRNSHSINVLILVCICSMGKYFSLERLRIST